MSRCLAKDGRAWTQFVDRFAGLIFWSIKTRLRQYNQDYTQQDLEDIFQNTFTLLWEKDKLGQVRNRQDICGWLVMVAANCALNYFRNKRERLLEPESWPALAAASSDYSPTAILNQEKIDCLLEQVFSLLSPQEEIIFKLAYLFGKTHQEIGKILKMPQSSVSSIISRTKEKLKEKLSKQGWPNI